VREVPKTVVSLTASELATSVMKVPIHCSIYCRDRTKAQLESGYITLLMSRDFITLQNTVTARKVIAVLTCMYTTMKVICLPANINCFIHLEFVRFEFPSAVTMRTTIFWDDII
jgi:hypothetical protein